MQFTEEHHSLYNTVKDFALNEIKPFADEWEKAGIFPAHELFKKMGDLDLLGITRDPEYGLAKTDTDYSKNCLPENPDVIL